MKRRGLRRLSPQGISLGAALGIAAAAVPLTAQVAPEPIGEAVVSAAVAAPPGARPTPAPSGETLPAPSAAPAAEESSPAAPVPLGLPVPSTGSAETAPPMPRRSAGHAARGLSGRLRAAVVGPRDALSLPYPEVPAAGERTARFRWVPLFDEPAVRVAQAARTVPAAPPAREPLGVPLGEPVGETASAAAVGAPAGGAMPGEPAGAVVAGEPVAGAVAAGETATGEAVASAALRAPERHGIWRLVPEGAYAAAETSPEISVITRVPASRQRGAHLNGYHIGHYPALGGPEGDYAPPQGYIEVTPENQDFHVSENFRLRQFLTKDQRDVWPKYLVLDLRLIDKLELVLEELNAMGVRADRMHVMSGYRTPQYNGPGGNGRARHSRHTYGDAADVWVDNDGDDYMDDLNGDGSVDLSDAEVMLRAVERVETKYPELVGGAGVYVATSAHGPFIHIDARGERSRW